MQLDGYTRRAATLGGALAAGMLVGATAVAQSPFDYNRLVEAYSTGYLDEAVSQLSRWPGEHIRDAVDAFVKATQARTAADGSLPAPLLPGAIMLHTDLAAALLGNDFPRAESHIGLARRLVDLLAERWRKDARVREFVTRWYEFAPSMYLLHQNPDKAFLLAQEGLVRAPDNATLHLYRGIVIEMTGPRQATYVTRGRSLTLTPGRAEAPLEPAAQAYRLALKADSRLAVARLHLGRVHFMQHDSRARADLEQTLADATDVSTRYLAHLFLGDVAERDRRLADALREYEAAITLGPLYQTAYVAAARMADALGQLERSREIALAFVGILKHEDPWWDYRLGGLNMPALEWLRRAAQAS